MPPLRFVLSAVLVMLLARDGAVAQSLRGSRTSVNRMYARAVGNDLEFLKTPKSVYDAVNVGDLVTIGITEDVFLDDVAYPFVLPKTRNVLYDFAARYRSACGERLVVTSAVRPRSEQPRNASKKSVHPTGMAVDFRKPGGRCLTFMRKELVAMEKRGILEATEERHPVHFHVAVLQRSAPVAAPAIVTTSPDSTASPAQAKGSATYAVRRGDTLTEIAKKFGTSVTRLKSLNNLRGSVLQPGQKLRVD